MSKSQGAEEPGDLSPLVQLLFNLHLLFYPRRFREAFGEEMRQTFALQLQESLARGPGLLGQTLAVTAFLAHWGIDGIRAGLSERIDSSVPQPAPNQELSSRRVARMGRRRSAESALDTWTRDVRFGFRGLRKRPLFALITILTLGVGIGSATAVFSVVDAVLLRPLPYSNPGSLVTVWESRRNIGDSEKIDVSSQDLPFTWSSYLALREHVSLMELSVFSGWGEMPLTGVGTPEQLSVGHGSANLFNLLGVRLALGRGFLPGEDGIAPGRAAQVAVLSHELWERRFGSNGDLLGSTITLDQMPFTVVGILPSGFRLQSEIVTVVGGGTDTGLRDLWVPIGQTGVSLGSEGNAFEVLGRLAPGTTLEQARNEAEAMLARLPAQDQVLTRITARKEVVTRGLSGPIWVLFFGTGLLLLIACGNVAGLLVSEATGRTHEIATRAALGASRSRLTRQLLTETALLGFLGSTAGLLLAPIGMSLLLSLAPPIPRLEEVQISARVFAFAVGAGLATSFLFGLAPLAMLARQPMGQVLGRRPRGSSAESHWVQRGTVSFQFALTVILLAVGGLFARSFLNVRNVDPGFRPDHLATLSISVPEGRYPTQTEASEFFRRVIEEVQAIPGVEGVAGSYGLPFPGGAPSNMLRFGPPGAEREIGARRRTVLPAYHKVMKIPLKAGRYLSNSDEVDQEPAMVISQSLASRYWPDESPIGATVSFWEQDWTIVGIVGDVHHTRLSTPGEPTFYVPFAQVQRRNLNLLARTVGEPGAIIPLLREAVWKVDPNIPLTEENTLSTLVDESMAGSGFRTLLILVMGGMASLLGAVGVFGVTATMVAQRARELGIRVALGANHGSLVAQTMTRTLRLAAGGILAGLLMAGATGRLLSHLLFGVEARDPATFAIVTSALLLICLFASLVPALRVTRMAPMEVLRQDG